jgi:hypothetical protein
MADPDLPLPATAIIDPRFLSPAELRSRHCCFVIPTEAGSEDIHTKKSFRKAIYTFSS